MWHTLGVINDTPTRTWHTLCREQHTHFENVIFILWNLKLICQILNKRCYTSRDRKYKSTLQLESPRCFNRIKWRPPSLSESTPYWISLGLTHLGSEASKYNDKKRLVISFYFVARKIIKSNLKFFDSSIWWKKKVDGNSFRLTFFLN